MSIACDYLVVGCIVDDQTSQNVCKEKNPLYFQTLYLGFLIYLGVFVAMGSSSPTPQFIFTP
jgi:hypothetical protein